jgi:hypothetical protein
VLSEILVMDYKFLLDLIIVATIIRRYNGGRIDRLY